MITAVGRGMKNLDDRMRFDEKNLFRIRKMKGRWKGVKIKSLSTDGFPPHPGHRTNISKLPNKLPLSALPPTYPHSFKQNKASKLNHKQQYETEKLLDRKQGAKNRHSHYAVT